LRVIVRSRISLTSDRSKNKRTGLVQLPITSFPTSKDGQSGRPAGGVLFGVSDAVSDLTYKFDLEVEF
jgi:hypothetical protein